MLSSIPIEVLAQITCRIHYLDIANLWFCGSSLNKKLAAGGIAQLRIPFGSNIRAFTDCSIFRQSTRITRFEIEDSYDSATLPDIQPLLIAISQTVREMFLHCSGSFWLLQGLLAQNTVAFPAIEKLEIVDTNINQRSGQLQWPKSLLMLSLPPTALELDMSTLPPNLTTLEAEFRQVVNTGRVPFPQSLTSLRLHLHEVPRYFVNLLPATLEKLHFSGINLADEESGAEWSPGCSSVKAWAKFMLPRLPQTLLELSWPVTDGFSREDLKAMPPTLTGLGGARFSTSDLDALPPLLTRSTSFFMVSLQKHHCSSLPRGLRFLNLESSGLPHLKPNANLTVNISDGNDGLRRELQGNSLSPYLTSLAFTETKDLPWEALPKTLKKLTLRGGSLDSEMAKMIPKDLKVMLLLNLSILDAETIKELPRRLETLTMHSVTLPSTAPSIWLPPTLHALTIYWSDGVSLDWLKGLPTSLKSLSVPLDLCISPIPWTISFPPHLQSITLDVKFPDDKQQEAMHSVLSALPQQLEELSINVKRVLSRMRYSYSLLAMLPKSLTRLQLPSNEERMDQETVRALLARRIISAHFGEVELLPKANVK